MYLYIWFFFLTLGGVLMASDFDLAKDVLIPKITGSWSLLKTEKTSKFGSQLIEVTPGHYYRTAPSQWLGLTSVYHTTRPKTFKLASDVVNVKAMNFVCDLPISQGQFNRVGDEWFVIGKKGKATNYQIAKIDWQLIPAMPIREHSSGNIRVALFDDYGSAGSGIPQCVKFLKTAQKMSLTLVKSRFIREGGLRHFDVVIFSGGSGGSQAASLGLVGREQVRRFVESGGGYIGICAGNYLACANYPWSLKLLDARTKSQFWARGEGQVKIEFNEKGQGVLGMPKGVMEICYANGPVFEPALIKGIPDYQTLATFRSELAENGSPKGIQINSAAMVSGFYGAGRVLCSSPHPEQQVGMEHFVEKAVMWAAGR
jgi:glutamine amidotransferase-like uncharacterized protein